MTRRGGRVELSLRGSSAPAALSLGLLCAPRLIAKCDRSPSVARRRWCHWSRLLVWRLDGPQAADALPYELDVASPNSRVRAVTAAAFAPAAAARAALGAVADRYDTQLATALLACCDYSGRLIVVQREPLNAEPEPATPVSPAAPSSAAKRRSLPGTASVPGA